jgi:predicted deacylase
MKGFPSLQTRTLASKETGPRLLVTGGVHGDEFEPILAIRRLFLHFEEEPLRCGSVTFVPVANEGAYFRGHRCAEDGRDLARTFPGRPDGSPTEVVAHALASLIASADYYIDLHTGGTELAVLPLAGYSMVSDAAVLETQRRMARAFNLPFIWGTSAELEGRSLSVARDAGVPAIYAEYLGSATCSQAGVEAYVEGVLNVMAEIGLIEREAPASRVEQVIEDTRPGSGHMQVCHPAPRDGYFEPAFSLGERVEKGQPLGQVHDFFGEESLPVPAEESGRLIVLRTFPRVRKGDSVGVIAGG